ncbi:hypothetical protein PV05_00734 [Exophiala xenobiotica]|uniref:Uncharacterized protein n=1 Tax=Exophiala xenobiotica TaxID=348802 RepID=A0A0D2DE30_9EURO|nr:uncharacterized protein PV05_00734 [Exophiala xenobiotica]KIW60522.1 hypothetical protein PV05_00734 [Exophiala xenobiotica]
MSNHDGAGGQRGDTEEGDMEKAIRLSLVDQAKKSSCPSRIVDSSRFPPTDLLLNLNNEFTPLDDPDGDTAIYIGPPPAKEPGLSNWQYSSICKHFDQIHVVQSSHLKRMPQTSRFTADDLLGPRSIRSEKSLRRLGVLNMAEIRHNGRFKYYINLRLPTEGEEAVEAITKLSCTNGVLTWHQSRHKYDLPILSVCGHDARERRHELFGLEPTSTTSSVPDAQATSQDDDSQGRSGKVAMEKEQVPEFKEPPAPIGQHYSQLRHCSAIERLLHAICGNDPKLDSAPKLWTFFAVAQEFGCAEHERISGWITAWIYNDTNINFIQNNPEVAYRIGMGIKSPDLVRDSFSILVGERALLYASSQQQPGSFPSNFKRSLHGREFEALDDDDLNRIGAAASSLVGRIRDEVRLLCQDLSWLRKSEEYAALDAILPYNPTEAEHLKAAKHIVKDYARTVIGYVLCQAQGLFTELEPNQTYVDVYDGLKLPVRLFTKTFWLTLAQADYEIGFQNVADECKSGLIGGSGFKEGLAVLGMDESEYPTSILNRPTFYNQIHAVNRFLFRRDVVSGKGKEDFDRVCGFGQAGSEQKKPTPAEGLSLGDLTIESPKHGCTESGSNAEDGSPSKRRKTLEPDETTQTSAYSTGVSVPSKQRLGDDSTWLPKEWLPQPGNGNAFTADNHADLAFRPKQEARESPARGILTHVKDFMHNRLGSPKVQIKTSPAASTTHLLGAVIADPLDSSPLNSDFQEETGEPSTSAGKPADSPLATPKPNNQKGLLEDGNTNRAGEQQPQRQRKPCIHDPEPSAPISTVRGELTFGTTAWYNQGRTTPVNQERPYYERIKAFKLLSEIHQQISNISSNFLYPAHLFHNALSLPTNLFDTILCLNANEFRYLPLWCPDGNDDGTGGVFDDRPFDIADPATSFRPGKIRKGYEEEDSDGGSAFEDIESQAISTVGKASKLATDGTETVKSLASISVGESADAETVILDDDAGSVVSCGVHSHDGMDGVDEDLDLDLEAEDSDDASTINGDVDQQRVSESLRSFLGASDGRATEAWISASASVSLPGMMEEESHGSSSPRQDNSTENGEEKDAKARPSKGEEDDEDDEVDEHEHDEDDDGFEWL